MVRATSRTSVAASSRVATAQVPTGHATTNATSWAAWQIRAHSVVTHRSSALVAQEIIFHSVAGAQTRWKPQKRSGWTAKCVQQDAPW
jgi:hypothetical protein